MSDKFTNNVRARLYKQGYQGFTKDDYTTAAISLSSAMTLTILPKSN
ncbi:hypothetical protein LC613_42910 [Nostoc sphaeroides CHAB 2801]|nr:hypothetical protein [Nostoc sphaeroides]MCC5634154.1 hypothetical protein [Nostoc sphaeroides CHAB 2801]